MSHTRKLAAVTLTLVATGVSAPAMAGSGSTATATFVPGSGIYLTGAGTDGLSLVGGRVTFTQAGSGAPIKVSGRLTGLRPLSRYVTVPYKDGGCAPVAGVTAFPSGSFTSDATGAATIPKGTSVNPQAINPLGAVDVSQLHSVSVRLVVLTPVPLPVVPGYPNGVPTGTPVVVPPATPTVPNVAYVEGCDRSPVVS